MVWFDGLYHRVQRLEEGQDRFEAQLRAALRPAPELQAVIDRLVSSLRDKGGFNCLHVSGADLEKNRGRVFARASKLLADGQHTLLASDMAMSNWLVSDCWIIG